MAKFDVQSLMRQAHKMQGEMTRVQEELKQTVVEGVAGGGMVKVQATCANEVRAISINPEVVDPEDVEMLQDLILLAIQDAAKQAADISNRRMSEVTGGIKMPF
ncbi:MAG: YbaB/EbfC family nucleoid-associated protein [Firmicutes bacterium]|nr:YbaB/EbfC family nucleoid-associated protein [Bacillota bacterium]MBQ3199197.1 YbaB/EbfC family nucleoid-associated protein [Bacillota bacterium]